jgi:hypothetical protein
MKLKFIPPPKETPIYIANVHRTGKIGFTIGAAKHFDINTSKSMALAVNDEDVNDDSIYGQLIVDSINLNGYKIMKGGEYHSVNAKGFFDAIQLDYSKPISFVVTDLEVNGTKLIKFTKREPKSKPNGKK